MDGIKGVGTTLITCHTHERGRVELVRFADGSVAVRMEGETLAIWEPQEEEVGIFAFFALTGFGKERAAGDEPDVILRVRRRSNRAAAEMN
jgi:hypothetical protein